MVEQKVGHEIQPLGPKDYPEGTVLEPGGSGVYCERCATKWAKQLGFDTASEDS